MYSTSLLQTVSRQMTDKTLPAFPNIREFEVSVRTPQSQNEHPGHNSCIVQRKENNWAPFNDLEFLLLI